MIWLLNQMFRREGRRRPTDVYALPPGAVGGLPASLGDATDALAASELAREWLGSRRYLEAL